METIAIVYRHKLA